MDIESKFTGLRLGIDEGCRVGCIMETSLEAICLFDQKCSKLNYNPNIYGRSKDNKKLDGKKEKCQKIVETSNGFSFFSLYFTSKPGKICCEFSTSLWAISSGAGG